MHLTADSVPDAPARAHLEKYLDCLSRWSGRINLTGAETSADAVRTLILPILGAESLLTGSVLDIGSGNGSPALVLAALRPDLAFTLLEPRAKRWAFLREAAREMGIENVSVRRERSDAYPGPPVDTITMRAVGLDPQTLRALVRSGGQVLVFGGPDLPGADRRVLPVGSSVQRLCFT